MLFAMELSSKLCMLFIMSVVALERAELALIDTMGNIQVTM